MGRITTPKYRIEFTVSTGHQTSAAWRTKSNGPNMPGYGNPNRDNLEVYMRKMIDSMEKPDGCNHHVIEKFGRGAIPYYARLVRQSDNQVMAIWYDYSYDFGYQRVDFADRKKEV